MGLWLAALSGLIAGGALLAGSAVAWFVQIPKRVVAAIMAVGAGVLISTLAYELVEEAADDGGLVPTVGGFLGGAVIYIVADWLVSRPRKSAPVATGTAGTSSAGGTAASPGRGGTPGAAGRGRTAGAVSIVGTAGAASTANIVARRAAGGSGVVIAIGALIDGIPESIVMGLSVLQGGLSIPIVAAIAISNIPEGLSSTAQLKSSGKSGWWIARLWVGIALVTVIASVLGFVAFQSAPANLIAVITTFAAGGLLAMICNTMIPEAFDEEHALTGLWATIGFLFAFVLHELA